jgi:hypothetical protein
MNNLKLLSLLSLLFIAGCGSATRDFKAEQQEYEAKKKENEAKIGGFFKSNEPAIREKLTTIRAALQGAHTSDYKNDDTTFFYNKAQIVFAGNSRGEIIYRATEEKEVQANAIALATFGAGEDVEKKEGLNFASAGFIKRLSECYADSFFVDCYKVPQKKLEDFLAINYVFAIREIIFAKPTMKGTGNKEFNGGLYMASVYVYDVSTPTDKPQPLYKFSFFGQNSDVVQVNSNAYMTEDKKLESNFYSNCIEAFNEKCGKHFNVVKPLEFDHFFFF